MNYEFFIFLDRWIPDVILAVGGLTGLFTRSSEIIPASKEVGCSLPRLPAKVLGRPATKTNSLVTHIDTDGEKIVNAIFLNQRSVNPSFLCQEKKKVQNMQTLATAYLVQAITYLLVLIDTCIISPSALTTAEELTPGLKTFSLFHSHFLSKTYFGPESRAEHNDKGISI